ncbi:MAG: hypothetical protein ACI9SE_001421 [Neolewinella sp.]|jgi:hypothetical protein
MACGIIIMGAIGWASLIALVVWQCVVLRTCQRHCRAMLLLPSAGLVAYALVMSLFASKLEWLMHMWLATPLTVLWLHLAWSCHKKQHACHRDGQVPTSNQS